MKVVLNLRSLNELEVVTFASTVITSLTGNAQFTPKPTLAALTTLRDWLSDEAVTVQSTVDALPADQ